jgi:hypothetical protein
MAFPSPVVPSLKATTPEGVKPSPALAALTITVKVTACPYTEAAGLTLTVVVSVARVTVWPIAGDWPLFWKLASPVYVALMA